MRLIKLVIILGIFFCTLATAGTHHKKPRHSHPKKMVKHQYVVTKKPVATLDASPKAAGNPDLMNQLNHLINETNQGADIGVYAKSMKYGDLLYSRNIYRPFTPASTMKILTAEAALIYLGSDYRFVTQILTDAKSVKNGVLQGNLYIVLNGDPTLTFSDLEELMAGLHNQQISAINGNVYIDNTAYDQSFYGPGWIWKDKNYCYGAPISASIINRNCLPFRVTPARQTGAMAQVLTSPNYFYPLIRNTVVTKSGKSCGLKLSTNLNSTISIDGCVSKRRESLGLSYVVADVPEYNRSLFKNLLNRMNIRVYGTVTFGSASSHLSQMATHTSEPLRVLVREMLKRSDNIIAGALFKKLGQSYTHRPGSWENGSLAVSQILAKHAGVKTTGMRILDGSGLSPNNLATPLQMMQVLEFAFHHYPTSYEFISALPIAGVDGTLRSRMGNIIRKVRAKTGYIKGVVALAGYVLSKDKEPIAFVIMINNTKGLNWQYKGLEDRIATLFTQYSRS